MALRPAGLQELEPISPELVLVSSPEVARRAREELREPPFWDTTAAALERPREPPARVDGSPTPQPGARRRGRTAAAAVAIGAIGAAVAYLAVTRDGTPRVGDPTAPTASATPTRPATGRATATTKVTAAPVTAAAHAAKQRGTAKPKGTQPEPSNHAKETKQRPHVTRASGFVPARTWTWPASVGARAYVMRLLLGGRVVLQRRTTQPRLVLPPTFRFRPGAYRWLVERVPANANGRPIVDSTFVLTSAAAAKANG